MKTDTAIILSASSNVSVVQLPERQFPGSVIQGDSLFSLFSDAISLVEELKHEPDSEAFHAAFSIAERLEGRLNHYIETCQAIGIEWKFRSSGSTKDYASLIELDT